MNKYDCPGHKPGTKCKWCGRKDGNAHVVGGTKMVVVERTLQGMTPKVDPCCKQCANNMEYARKKFGHPDIAARFRTRIPKGDEV